MAHPPPNVARKVMSLMKGRGKQNIFARRTVDDALVELDPTQVIPAELLTAMIQYKKMDNKSLFAAWMIQTTVCNLESLVGIGTFFKV